MSQTSGWSWLAAALAMAVAFWAPQPAFSAQNEEPETVFELPGEDSPPPAEPSPQPPARAADEPEVEFDLGDKSEATPPATTGEPDVEFDIGPDGEEPSGEASATATDETAAEATADDDVEGWPTLREQLDELPFYLGGFLDARYGTRTQNDPHQPPTTLGELRLQLQAEKAFDDGSVFRFTPDFLLDPVPEERSFNLEEGTGWLDVRELNYQFTPVEFMDVKVGRQILTWGTGDMVFLNDLFPKDWQSFLSGRDVEYLKAPSDAVKSSFFTDLVNLDVVYVPRFDADRYVSGSRLSYWNPLLGRRAGRDNMLPVATPDDWFSDSEVHWRFFRTIRGYELAAYGYYGFWKTPAGIAPARSTFIHPDLSAYGWSARGPLYKGIINVEMAYYDSRDDRSGNDPFIPNSQIRGLVGYTQEVARDFNVGVQYYVEQMMNYSSYTRTLPAGQPRNDRTRHLVTLRLTKLALNQNLTLSLFTFYSPSDQDAYFRPLASYKISDDWAVDVGANFFVGRDSNTFFGQFEDNSNVYVSLRYSF